MKEIIKKINTAKTIGIFTHINTDPDAIGSANTLYRLFEKMGKKPYFFFSEKISSDYSFLNLDLEKNEKLIQELDLLIAVDASTHERLGDFAEEFLKHNNTVAFDHHPVRKPFAKNEFVDSTASSCGEILYSFVKKMKIKISKEIATSIYMSIAGDTNCFLNDNSTSKAHEITADLIKIGADFRLVNKQIFKSQPKKKFKLLNSVLNNFDYFGNALIVPVNNKDLTDAGYLSEETTGLIDIMTSIKGVDIACLITEKKPNLIYASFRCTAEYNVAKIAEKFGGGGHVQAAAFSNLGNIEEYVSKIKKEIKAMQKNK